MDPRLLGGALGAMTMGMGISSLALLYLWWWRRFPHLLFWGAGFLLIGLSFLVVTPFQFPHAPPPRLGLFLLLFPAGSLSMLAGTARFFSVRIPLLFWCLAALLLIPPVLLSGAGFPLPGAVPVAIWLGLGLVAAPQMWWYWRDGRPLCRGIALSGTMLVAIQMAFFLLRQREDFLSLAMVAAGLGISLAAVSLGALALEEERKRVTAMHEERNRMLEEHNQELTHFLSRLSHEIKTPLTVVKGTSELLRHTLEKGSANAEGTRASLRLVEDQTRQAAKVVDALVEFAAAGALREPPTLVQTAAPLGRAVARVEKETGRRLALAIGNLPLLMVQESCLEEIFYQLLLNAAIHGDSDEPVEVDCRRTEGRFHFLVRDHGKGLPSEVVDQLFLPLVRGMGRPAPGRGLGLAKVRKLVEAQGGQAWVDKGKAGGCAIAFTLPANPGPA